MPLAVVNAPSNAADDPFASPEAPAVVSRAFVRAAALLGLTQAAQARLLGISPASASRLGRGRRTIDPAAKEGELALLLLRVYRSLDALVGGEASGLRAWFHARNLHLGEVPAALVETARGLVHVAEYLDAMRGRL